MDGKTDIWLIIKTYSADVKNIRHWSELIKIMAYLEEKTDEYSHVLR